jgi:regulator of cell morphogenesis and NO signaling
MNTEIMLSEIVKRDYRAASVLERFGLDFCCNGKKSLASSCEESGIDLKNVIDALLAIPAHYEDQDDRFDQWHADTLCDYIQNEHHRYVRKAVPTIAAHLKKVALAHGEKYQNLHKIADLFQKISADLLIHMDNEEKILFPHIRRMVMSLQNLQPLPVPIYQSVRNPISVMEVEHEIAGDGVRQIRKLTNGYTCPPEACMTFQTLYKELAEFESNLHRHVHLENNVLFPKAAELETKLSYHTV